MFLETILAAKRTITPNTAFAQIKAVSGYYDQRRFQSTRNQKASDFVPPDAAIAIIAWAALYQHINKKTSCPRAALLD